MELLLVLAAWAVMGVVGRLLQSPSAHDDTTPPASAPKEDIPRWLADLTARLDEWANEDDTPAEAAPSAPPAEAAPVTTRPVHVTATAAPVPPAPSPHPAPTAAVASAVTLARPARRPLTHDEWRHAMVMATIFNPPRAEDPYRWPE